MTALVQLEVADYALGLRGKVIRREKLAGSRHPAFCTIVYGLDAGDDVADTALASAANGYPDAFARPDEDTRVALPWRRDTEAVLARLVTADGTPVAEDPRNLVSTLADRFAEHGLVPVFGFEYEVRVYAGSASPHLTPADLAPADRIRNSYSLTRSAAADELAAEFINRMDAVGITVEAFHSELGSGFFEWALAPLPAAAAADAAARARQYFKDLCAEQGLRASFMAKPQVGAPGVGGHVHQSLSRDGTNILCSQPGVFSPAGRAYLAGLLDLMPALTLLMCPNPNSYRRLSGEFFVAEHATWGWDHRSAACRVIAAATADARIEHRLPGADASPYLSAAAMLAGGLHGLQTEPELAAPLNQGSRAATSRRDARSLPRAMAEAITALDESPATRKLLGEDFTASFIASRRSELNQFRKWQESHVTTWETERYLEAL